MGKGVFAEPETCEVQIAGASITEEVAGILEEVGFLVALKFRYHETDMEREENERQDPEAEVTGLKSPKPQ